MKNKRALISMTDYVLYLSNDDNIFKIFEDEKSLRNYWSKTFSYAKFLKQPLTLGMFVPVDEEGNVLKKPEHYELWRKYGSFTQHGESIVNECKEYNKALENVLFEGFEWDKFKSYLYFISLPGTNITFEYHIDEKQIYWKERCIEDLVVYAVILTESAIKKYNI